jgi:hypothetical protein
MSMPDRERLPNRRGSENIDFSVRGQKYIATVSRYEDGRLAEFFINDAGKAGTDVEINAAEGAIVLSFARQYGAPIEKIRKAMPRSPAGSPLGPLGKLLDLLAADERAAKKATGE